MLINRGTTCRRSASLQHSWLAPNRKTKVTTLKSFVLKAIYAVVVWPCVCNTVYTLSFCHPAKERLHAVLGAPQLFG